jgi:ABC-type transport system involved in cytochrome c biogenesis permease subunit
VGTGDPFWIFPQDSQAFPVLIWKMIGTAVLTMIVVAIPEKSQGSPAFLTIHEFSCVVTFIIISLAVSWEGSDTKMYDLIGTGTRTV